jgi:nucleotidyltransferase substrate binding protein (TIGR01987 family)
MLIELERWYSAMSEKCDIRWQQRFSNYRKALKQMGEFLDKQNLNKLEEQGLVKAFEYTFELAWNTLKDFMEYQGISEIVGSRDAVRKAFSEDILKNGHVWMQMIESRNKTSHTYNEKTADEIVRLVKEAYHPAFCELEKTLAKRLES